MLLMKIQCTIFTICACTPSVSVLHCLLDTVSPY
jgi:hypothetical protein